MITLDGFLKPVKPTGGPSPPIKKDGRQKRREVTDDKLLALLHRCVNIYRPRFFDVKDFFLGLHEDLGWPPRAIRGKDGYATPEAAEVLGRVVALWGEMEAERGAEVEAPDRRKRGESESGRRRKAPPTLARRPKGNPCGGASP